MAGRYSRLLNIIGLLAIVFSAAPRHTVFIEAKALSSSSRSAAHYQQSGFFKTSRPNQHLQRLNKLQQATMSTESKTTAASTASGSAPVVVASSSSATGNSINNKTESFLKSTLKMTVLFLAWYGFNAGYNVFNAYTKQSFQFPWMSATMQLAIGLLYLIPVYSLKFRELPQLTYNDILKLLPIAAMNAIGHVSAVVAMFEKGGGSFTHVIKASEPVVSVLMSLVVSGIIPKPLTAASLLPITYGVAYASTLGNLNVATMSTELTTKAAKMAMVSNFAFAMRSILRKNLSGDFKKRTKLDPSNEHAVTTILSFLMLLPVALSFESPADIISGFNAIADKTSFMKNAISCGFCFYLYNELQNIVLGSLGPVPTAVGNTLKRVAIFVALYFFTAGETFPWPKVVGCGIAIAGCFAFAVFDSMKV